MPELEHRSSYLQRWHSLHSIMYLALSVPRNFVSHRAQKTSLTYLCSPLSSVWARRNTDTRFLSCIPDHKHWRFFTKKWSDYSPATTCGRTHTYKVLALKAVSTGLTSLVEHRLLRREASLLYNTDACLSVLAVIILGFWGRPSRALKGSIRSPPYGYPCCPAQKHRAFQIGAQFSFSHCSRMVLSDRYGLVQSLVLSLVCCALPLGQGAVWQGKAGS